MNRNLRGQSARRLCCQPGLARIALWLGVLWLGVLPLPSAHAYNLLGATWNSDLGPVPYHLEPSGSADISDGSDLDALRESFHRWACVPGSSLRFVEGSAAGVKEVDLSDGVNSLFWDEDGSFGLGPATLGVTVGAAPEPGGSAVIRDAADIVFNGADHTWATTESEVAAGKVDVASIAIHEIGHWLGLGHPCDDPQETQCLGPDRAIMTPAYVGGLTREPRDDDIAGLLAMYPATDESRCEGPFRQGEACSCNDDCVNGLLCVDGVDGARVCSPTCTAAAADCPVGFACVLGPRPANGAPANGICRRVGASARTPVAALCERDTDCEVGLCLSTPVIGRTVCRKSCEAEDDCPMSYRCIEEVCVAQGAVEGTVCPASPEPDGSGCSCRTTSPGTVAVWALLLALVRGGRSRRPRAPRAQAREA